MPALSDADGQGEQKQPELGEQKQPAPDKTDEKCAKEKEKASASVDDNSTVANYIQKSDNDEHKARA